MNNIIKNLLAKIQLLLNNKLVKKFLNFKENVSQTIIELKLKNFSISEYKKFSLSYMVVLLCIVFLITKEREDPKKLLVSTIFAEYLIAQSNYAVYNKVDGAKKNYQFIDKNIYQKCISNMKDDGCSGFRKTIGETYAQNFSFDDVDIDKDGRANVYEIRNRFYWQESRNINNKKFKWDYKLIDEALGSKNLEEKVDAYMNYLKNGIFSSKKHTRFGIEEFRARHNQDLNGDFVLEKWDLKKYFIVEDGVFEPKNFKNGKPDKAKIAQSWRESAKSWRESASEKKRRNREEIRETQKARANAREKARQCLSIQRTAWNQFTKGDRYYYAPAFVDSRNWAKANCPSINLPPGG